MNKRVIREKVRDGLITENRVRFDIPIPQDIIEIKNVFVKNGFKLYVVGGAVRDALLNKSPKDWDLATDATPDRVEQIMKEGGFRTLPTGKAFGVINVFTDSDEYEVATFRKDIGVGRRPDSVEFTSIDQDVKRRDLTINALFYDIDTKEVVDLVGGIEDLKNKVVKTVGDPVDRFGEDRLRILRAIRFAARFGSGLDPEVDNALKQDSSLEGISSERIRDEFLKGLRTAKTVKYFLKLIDKYELWGWIFKGVEGVNRDFIEERDPIVLIAWMMWGNNPSELSKALNKLTYSSSETNKICFLVSLYDFEIENVVVFKKLQHRSGIGDEQLRSFGKLVKFDTKVQEAFIKFQLSVTGDYVQKELGIAPGPEMGKAIKKIETDNFKKLL
tara:strand:+ start:114254 stop:115414 length:1161 start_codon:yes stop_codon:yes gene_type:complete